MNKKNKKSTVILINRKISKYFIHKGYSASVSSKYILYFGVYVLIQKHKKSVKEIITL